MNIRLATASDIPAIIALERQCASAAHWTEQQYQDLFPNPIAPPPKRVVLVIAESPTLPEKPESNPLGLLIAHNLDREWELENIAVAPAARKRGIATMLVQELISRAREADGESVFLEVRESNRPARALYEKLGFRQSGRRKAYYQRPLEDALLYRLALS